VSGWGEGSKDSEVKARYSHFPRMSNISELIG
jgi:hypothetical protein